MTYSVVRCILSFVLITAMHLLQVIFGFLIVISLVFMPLFPANAASSSAIRSDRVINALNRNYAGQSLISVEFGDSNLEGADFNHADLRGAVFNGAKLKNANLQEVDFSNGIAYITDFSGADLTNAVLNSAMLLKSTFQGTTIVGADFSDATLDRDQVIELCKSASGTNSITGIDTRESLECR